MTSKKLELALRQQIKDLKLAVQYQAETIRLLAERKPAQGISVTQAEKFIRHWTFWAESDERFSDDPVHKFRGESLRQCISEVQEALSKKG